MLTAARVAARVGGVLLALALFGLVVTACAVLLVLFGEEEPLDDAPPQTAYPHRKIRA